MKPRVFELWEPEQVLQTDTADGDLVESDYVPGSDAMLETGETPDNSTYIDTASDDWTWCANPIAIEKNGRS